jgi:long-chain acyl-CoA synthetase
VNDVLEARARIEKAVAGQTLLTAFAATVAEEGDKPAYSDKNGVAEGGRTLSWTQTADQARTVAAGLIAYGVQPGDTVAVMASNRIEHVLADLGALHSGATPMSIYNTLAPDQVAYIAGQSAPKVVIVETADHLGRWDTVLAGDEVAKVVVIDEAARPEGDRFATWAELLEEGTTARRTAAADTEIDRRVADTSPDQPVTILYTSGTTGHPKGVVITHHMVLFEAVSSLETADPQGENVFISYLPFAHIAERTLGMYIPWIRGANIHLIGDPAQLLGALGEVRPTRFFGVPRVWEKIRTGVSAKLAAEPDDAKRAGIEQAMAVGLAWVESQQYGETTSPELQAQFEAADAQILGLLRMLLGLDRCEWAASAAAPMPLEVARFFAGLGMKIYDVYGMTETCAAVTSCGPDSFRLGTVGRALAGIEVTLADDGEILARGPVSTPGYFRQEDATRTLIDDAAGCTPATSASSTATASSRWSTGRRS